MLSAKNFLAETMVLEISSLYCRCIMLDEPNLFPILALVVPVFRCVFSGSIPRSWHEKRTSVSTDNHWESRQCFRKFPMLAWSIFRNFNVVLHSTEASDLFSFMKATTMTNMSRKNHDPVMINVKPHARCMFFMFQNDCQQGAFETFEQELIWLISVQ